MVRQRSAKPLFSSSNLDAASIKKIYSHLCGSLHTLQFNKSRVFKPPKLAFLSPRCQQKKFAQAYFFVDFNLTSEL